MYIKNARLPNIREAGFLSLFKNRVRQQNCVKRSSEEGQLVSSSDTHWSPFA